MHTDGNFFMAINTEDKFRSSRVNNKWNLQIWLWKFDFDFVLKILKMTKNVCNIFRTKLLFVRLFSSLYNFLLLKLTDVWILLDS